MAKYTITYKCGHTAEVQLYGKYEERERKIKWYATINCPDCEAKEQREIAEKAGLPTLTGSEKQIAWATKIRNNALETLNGHIEAYVAPHNKHIITDARDKWIVKETASSYWIENRDDLGDIRSIVKLIETSTKNK